MSATTQSDRELLARYTRHQAEDAFTEIVRRHLALVFSAALRQVRSPQLAEEVAQCAFLKLARHARQLTPNTILSAWLYQVTRREAIDVVRRDIRYPNLLADLTTFRHDDFHFSNFEMETAAYFALGRLMGHETASVNAIIANRVLGEFSKNASEVLDGLILKVLERI